MHRVTVAGRRCAMSVLTGICVKMLVPKSPRNT